MDDDEVMTGNEGVIPESETHPGAIIKYDLSEQMKKSYIEYAMSVIIARALPDARDGLKPVHRRILYGMWDMGIRYNTANKKCARIVGDVLGKYHPHGDASVYDALVRLGQDFSLRYPVVFPQGNFGSIDGDPAAAMRYTEARMAKIGEEMMADISKNTVDWMGNYDESLKEPVVLPAAFPFLICNGSSGIAVGMATNMAPHNLSEVVEGICALIDNPELTNIELMDFVKGPDFPSSGIICGKKGIVDAFTTGRGKIVIRSKYEIEDANPHSKDDMNKTHDAIYFTELPYQVNKAELVKKIDEYRKDGVIPGIAQVKDLSGRKGLRVAVYLKSGAIPNIVLNMLFQKTALQSNFNVYNLALYKGRPKLLTLKDMLQIYIDHREEVTERRTRYDLDKAKEREHILLGLKIGLENIDEVIRIIKEAADETVAQLELQAAFNLDALQSDAIIKMRLGRLSHLEVDKILNELTEIEKKIAEYNYILSDRKNVLKVVQDEIRKLGEVYGDERRTVIVERELNDASPEDFIKKEEVIITFSAKGFAKRIPAEEYKSQGRGGKGTIGAKLVEGDYVDYLLACSSHDIIFLVSNFGKAYYVKAFEIPENSKTSKGISMKNILQLESGETITNMLTFPEFAEDEYILMVTKYGVAKRVKLNDFRNAKTRGIKAIILDEGDELKQTVFVKEDDDVMLITRGGKGLRTKISDIRTMGRATHGVRGMKLVGKDEIAGVVKVEEGKDILMMTEKGKGKRTKFSEFMPHGRGTLGQKIYTLLAGDGIVDAFAVDDNDDVVFMTAKGQVIRVHVSSISCLGRAAQGVIVAKFKKQDDNIQVMAITNRALSEESQATTSEENTTDSLASKEEKSEKIPESEE